MSDHALVRMTLPGVVRSVPLARRWVADALTAAGHRGTDGVRLVTSELVGNAVLHTRSGRPGGVVMVKVFEVGKALARIEVLDEGALTVPKPQKPDDCDCHGRGLWLVQQTSVRWGTRTVALRWNLVWAEVATQEAGSASEFLGVGEEPAAEVSEVRRPMPALDGQNG
ncbi:ATP-binding protein [Nonomuraea aurantiaca]|uniref:ATP-binding protein n=1 Tax=Nonomuraea aurantiaca TaxID=2878562 RepID=UPI001CD9B144|nr:ATP-binding protein [Nonomuraea aurantiaca]MCA2224414.1 ATP-binding protein [Nonomuraea aurantiaca]